MKVSKKKLVSLVAAALSLSLAMSSWAYFTSVASIDNEAQTKGYGSRTIENFTPNQDLQPGETITKEVGVTNTGDYPLVVRIKMDEKWERGGVTFKTIDYTGKIATVAHTAASGGTPESWIANQVNAADGLVPTTDDEETVIFKKLDLINWIDGYDGYFYHLTVVPAQDSTSRFMESITMAVNADVGAYVLTTYYSTKPRSVVEPAIAAIEADFASNLITADQRDQQINAVYDWNTIPPINVSEINYTKIDNELIPGREGYSNADYTLTITTEVCQATSAAVTSTWDMTANFVVQSILSNWHLS